MPRGNKHKDGLSIDRILEEYGYYDWNVQLKSLSDNSSRAAHVKHVDTCDCVRCCAKAGLQGKEMPF